MTAPQEHGNGHLESVIYLLQAVRRIRCEPGAALVPSVAPRGFVANTVLQVWILLVAAYAESTGSRILTCTGNGHSPVDVAEAGQRHELGRRPQENRSGC